MGDERRQGDAGCRNELKMTIFRSHPVKFRDDFMSERSSGSRTREVIENKRPESPFSASRT
jgi:hypothetical protein